MVVVHVYDPYFKDNLCSAPKTRPIHNNVQNKLQQMENGVNRNISKENQMPRIDL